MSHALTQNVSGTSSIVSVLVSSATEPHREMLTYTLLNTQSDFNFILEILISELNVSTHPVQLKVSTRHKHNQQNSQWSSSLKSSG